MVLPDLKGFAGKKEKKKTKKGGRGIGHREKLVIFTENDFGHTLLCSTLFFFPNVRLSAAILS